MIQRTAVALILLLFVIPVSAQRVMEKLGRGVVAVNLGSGKVFVSWRLLGTEPQDIAFNLYRQPAGGPAVKVNDEPLAKGTNFTDAKANLGRPIAYFVRPIINGQEQEPSEPFRMIASPPIRQYRAIKLKPGLEPNDASVADLDGDGEYEIILKRHQNPQNNAIAGITGETHIEAYKLDGRFMWRINMGRNIRSGDHYTQFMVADYDGDGKAEMFCKTSDGTVDGKGKVIGDPNADWRNDQGRIMSGPEFLTVFDGMTGAALATTDYIAPRHPTNPINPTPAQYREIWGDNYGQRGDVMLAAVAYLDGKLPSAVMCRGYYTRAVLAAWDWRDGKLTSRWVFDTNDPKHPENLVYRGEGNHNLAVADVDNDGKDEIIFGACAIDDNGTGLHTTGWGHGDAMHVTDHDPTRPGLEVFNIQEHFGDAGANFRDASTGREIWKKASVRAATEGPDRGEGPGRAAAFDIDPRYPGSECWVAGAGLGNNLWNAKGEKISDARPDSCNFAIWWDGDLLRELLDKNRISKWDWNSGTANAIFVADDCISNNGTKATPTLVADLYGDWREEVIFRTEDNSELRIFTTTIPTDHRIHTLMHDPQYRMAIAWQNVAYNQPPATSFFLGHDMKQPPKPNITTDPVAKAQTPPSRGTRAPRGAAR